MPDESASPWFVCERAHASILRLWEPHVHRFFRGNIWLVEGRDADLVVDFGMGLASLAAALPRNADKPVLAVATHSHADHIGSFHEFGERLGHHLEAEGFALAPDRITLAQAFRDATEPVTLLPTTEWKADAYAIQGAPLTRIIGEGDRIDLGDFSFQVLHLPGHSPGSIGLLDTERKILFAGDAIYRGTLVDDIPGADIGAYLETMKRLASLDVETVYGGHNEPISGDEMRSIAVGYIQRREAAL